MKKIIIFVSILAIVFVSCTKDFGPGQVTPAQPPQPDVKTVKVKKGLDFMAPTRTTPPSPKPPKM